MASNEIEPGDKIKQGGQTRITVGESLGSGGEGSVYRIRGSNSTAVKIFEDEHRREKREKVNTMIQNKPRDPTLKQHGVRSITWPDEIVTDRAGSFLGYTMPYKDLDEVKPALEYAMVELNRNNSTREERFGSALNLATAVKAVHDRGHAIGDFNHENILLNDGFVTLIDCDSFEISGNQKTHSGTTYFKRYAPPEKRGDEPREVQETDRFCLGVHIFQFLLQGAHPFQAQSANGDWPNVIRETSFPYLYDNTDVRPIGDNQKLYNQLPSSVRDLFEDCFDSAAKNVGYGRPKPGDWRDVLKKELNSDEHEPTNLSIKYSGDKPKPNDTITLTITGEYPQRDDKPVANATVKKDGSKVGTTNNDGTISVDVPDKDNMQIDTSLGSAEDSDKIDINNLPLGLKIYGDDDSDTVGADDDDSDTVGADDIERWN